MQAGQNRKGCEAEARPVDETAETEQGQRSAFCKWAAARAAKTGYRNPGTGRSPQKRSGGPFLARGYSRTGHTQSSLSSGWGSFLCKPDETAQSRRVLWTKQSRRSRGSRPNLQAGGDPRRKFGKRQPRAARRFLQTPSRTHRKMWAETAPYGRYAEKALHHTMQGLLLLGSV